MAKDEDDSDLKRFYRRIYRNLNLNLNINTNINTERCPVMDETDGSLNRWQRDYVVLCSLNTTLNMINILS